MPAAGLWEITWYFATVREYARVTLPTRQCALEIALLAALSLSPRTLGTTHLTRRLVVVVVVVVVLVVVVLVVVVLVVVAVVVLVVVVVDVVV